MRKGIAPIDPLRGKEAVEYLENRLKFPIPVLLSFPKYFMIELINICNSRCVMCGIDFDSKTRAVLSDELFTKIYDEISLHKDHVEKVMLYLDCEPLLDKKLPQRIKQMKDAGIRWVNIATNASTLTQENAGRIIEAGLNEIYITIDSLKKEVFEKIRVGLKFKTVYDNIINFIALRDKLNPKMVIRLQMVLQELNCDESEDFKRCWTPKLKAKDQVVITREHNWASKVDAVDLMKDNEDVNRKPCIAIWGTFCIHVNGVVGLCCLDSESEIPLGDINKQSIEEIWKSAYLNQLRQKHLSGRRHEIHLCDGCTLWRDVKHVEKNDLEGSYGRT